MYVPKELVQTSNTSIGQFQIEQLRLPYRTLQAPPSHRQPAPPRTAALAVDPAPAAAAAAATDTTTAAFAPAAAAAADVDC